MSKVAVYRQPGQTISYTAGDTAVSVGDVIVLGSRIGIALADIAAGATGDVRVTGVWELPAVDNASFNQGDALYWDATAKKLTKTAASNTLAGWAVAAKTTTGMTAYIRIDDGHDGTLQDSIESLAEDVGDLAGLNTAEKQTIVGAINEVAGRVAANQSASTAAELAALVADFNTLLASLKAAGLMIADE